MLQKETMWRFLHNIPRALKNYHAPRASIGVYVESDDKEQESAVVQEKDHLKHVAQTKAENSFCPFQNANIKGTTILWRLVSRRKSCPSSDCSATSADEHEENGSNHEEAQDWWNSCLKDTLAFFQGYQRIRDALAAKSSLLWGLSHRNRSQKSDLIYRVIFSIGEKDLSNGGVKSCTGSSSQEIVVVPKLGGQSLLAIKDAAGSELDRAINETKSETLDAALKEFEHMCSDYTAQNESLLGIMAADKGEMSEAIKHFHTACSTGNKTACFNLGLCYEMGTGVSRNLDKAQHYYELAAMKGHGQAMYNLSLLYLNEDGLLEDPRTDREKGIKWMEMAARTGLAQAQKYMGVYYMEEMSDAKMAVAYFKAAAGQHDNEAQYFLALCHEHGLGVEVNECWAGHLYSMAATGGHDEAIYNLARFNELGLGGIPSDVVTANELYTKAAKLGNEDAKNRLEELRESKQKDGQIHIMNQSNNWHKASLVRSSSPSSPHANCLNSSSSSSSPDLRSMDCSLSDFFYQRLYDFFQPREDNKPEMFHPGGFKGIRFQIGGDGIKIDNIVSDADSNTIRDSVTSRKCSPKFHKSNTTPNLSSMVACNI